MRAIALLALAGFSLLAPWLTPPGRAQQPQQQAMVAAVNECAQPVAMLVSVVSASGKRETLGWFNIPANKDQMLFTSAGGGPVMHNVAHPFYIYAKNADGSLTWEADDLRVEWEGRGYRMQQRDLSVVEAGPLLVRAVAIAC